MKISCTLAWNKTHRWHFGNTWITVVASSEAPVKDTNIFSKSWPKESSFGGFSEPINHEDFWQREIFLEMKKDFSKTSFEVIKTWKNSWNPHLCAHIIPFSRGTTSAISSGQNYIQKKGRILKGSCITIFPLCSAAAVASDFKAAPRKTPCSHDNAWETNGIPSGLRPPKRMASILTPSGSSHWSSRMGQFSAGEQNRLKNSKK